MAPVRAYPYEWKSDSASSFEGRAFAGILLRCLHEVGFVAGCASGRRIDCALSGGEKRVRRWTDSPWRTWSVMVTSGALCGGLSLHDLFSSWSHRGRVRCRGVMARVLLLQFSAQHVAAS